jgi:hypothetical protein
MTMAKNYLLDVATLHDVDNGEIMVVFSKGHHDFKAFCDYAKEWQDIDVEPSMVQHGYMRWELCWTEDGPRQCGALHNEPGRGKFPVTFWDRELTLMEIARKQREEREGKG